MKRKSHSLVIILILVLIVASGCSVPPTRKGVESFPTPKPIRVVKVISPSPDSSSNQPQLPEVSEALPIYIDASSNVFVYADENSGVLETINLKGTWEGEILGLESVDIIAKTGDLSGMDGPAFSSEKLHKGFVAIRRYGTTCNFYDEFPEGHYNNQPDPGVQPANEVFSCLIASLMIDKVGTGTILQVDRMVVFSPDQASFEMKLGRYY